MNRLLNFLKRQEPRTTRIVGATLFVIGYGIGTIIRAVFWGRQ